VENFENEHFSVNTFTPEKKNDEKRLFTPILMPYDFESHDPIGDLFKKVDLDGTVVSGKKSNFNKIDSEAASLITECPPGTKPDGSINVNSTYLSCKPDGTPMKPEVDHKFLAEKNACVFKSKYKSPNSAVASTLMPRASNIRTETDEQDMVTRSGTGSRVFSDYKVRENGLTEKFQVSDKDMVTRSGTGTDVFSDLDKHQYSGKQSKLERNYKIEGKEMITRSGTGTDVLSELDKHQYSGKQSKLEKNYKIEGREMITRSGTGTDVLSDLDKHQYSGKQSNLETNYKITGKEMITKSGTGTDVFSELDKHKYSGKQAEIPKSFKLKEEDRKMVTRSGSGSDVLSSVLSDTGLSTSSLSTSIGSSPSSSSTSKKNTKSDVKSYKVAVLNAAKEKYENTSSE